MDPKDKDLLNRTFEYARENNDILKKMRSGLRWSKFFRLLYWAVIIIASLWLYQTLSPGISNLMETYKSLL